MLQSMDENSQTITVIVRIKPFENSSGNHSCIKNNPDHPQWVILEPEQKFCYDYVSNENGDTQEEFCGIIAKPLTRQCLEGLNCCIFAYGQTGAGKTYTMLGEGGSVNRGLQPRVKENIFESIQKQHPETDSFEWTIKCSYLEIYNEQMIDLLNPNKGTSLNIREDFKRGVYVEDLQEEQTKTYDEAIYLLQKGQQNRHVSSTLMNHESSRSHTIFTMNIETKATKNGIVSQLRSKMNFVDLAGSERQIKTAAQGERLKEAGLINKSLTVLGYVITALVDQSTNSKRFVPYRDSKLTFILRESLGGNSKTYMIANISSSSSQYQETLSTLKFAQRTKQIKNQAIINNDETGSIDSLKSEIKRLKNSLAELTTIKNSVPTQSAVKQMWLGNELRDPNQDEMPPKPIEMQQSFLIEEVQIKDLDKQKLRSNTINQLFLKETENFELLREVEKLENKNNELVLLCQDLDLKINQLTQEKQSIEAQLYCRSSQLLPSSNIIEQETEREQQQILEFVHQQKNVKQTVESQQQYEAELQRANELILSLRTEIEYQTQQINSLASIHNLKYAEYQKMDEQRVIENQKLKDQIDRLNDEIDTLNVANQFQYAEAERKNLDKANLLKLNQKLAQEYSDLLKNQQIKIEQSEICQKIQVNQLKPEEVPKKVQKKLANLQKYVRKLNQQSKKQKNELMQLEEQFMQEEKTLKSNILEITNQNTQLAKELLLKNDQNELSEMRRCKHYYRMKVQDLEIDLVSYQDKITALTQENRNLQNEVVKFKQNEDLLKFKLTKLTQQSELVKKQCESLKKSKLIETISSDSNDEEDWSSKEQTQLQRFNQESHVQIRIGKSSRKEIQDLPENSSYNLRSRQQYHSMIKVESQASPNTKQIRNMFMSFYLGDNKHKKIKPSD